MSSTVYVVTGASRGIGLAFVEQLAKRPDTIVFAGVRSLPLDASHPLSQLAGSHSGRVVPVALTSADVKGNQATAQAIREQVGKVDVVIANAGQSTGITPLLEVTADQLNTDFTVNTIGPIVLYQAFASLLEKSDSAKFIIVSSVLAQIKESLPYEYNAYGISKAGANLVAKRIDQMNPKVVALPVSPGMVDTDMGRSGAQALGYTAQQMGAITATDSALGMLRIVDAATKESHGGKFWSYTGEEMSY